MAKLAVSTKCNMRLSQKVMVAGRNIPRLPLKPALKAEQMKSKDFGKTIRFIRARNAENVFKCVAFQTKPDNSGIEESSDILGRTEPLPPISDLGKKLSSVLQMQPETFEYFLEKQLDELVLEKKNEENLQNTSCRKISTNKLDFGVLNNRISKRRARERENALDDVLYTSILANLADFNTSLTSGSAPGDLEWLHSGASRLDLQALLDMFSSNAMSLVLPRVQAAVAGLPRSSNDTPVTHSRLGVAQMYRRMVLFGYVLRQVTEQYKLECITPDQSNEEIGTLCEYAIKFLGQEEKTGGISFVALEERAEFCTHAASRVFNRHTKAVFGSMMKMAAGMKELIAGAKSYDEAKKRMEFGLHDGQIESIELNLSALSHLFVEAIMFGSLLRQAECKVDLKYGLK
eukprot:CAMPEP_0196592174 /NCGR_PEP_ID=MMETSP1081-20130531/71932_1 /TAXON_ID=36882 /ORGANISM="Pyramimonas amylifera, Strain CCMP720" /LENGTH=402 /DNA_ID=CAMNT_0041915775 /DNA_START=104 /DNA_END=1312 /DNA_ORIENTATION=+